MSLDEALAIATGAEPASAKLPARPRRDTIIILGGWPAVSADEEARIAGTLGELLSADSRELQHAAAMALGMRGHVEFLSDLFGRLECDPGLFRSFYFVQPNYGGAPPTELLRAGLLSHNPTAGEYIVEVIGTHKLAKFRADVERLLDDDPSEWVRRESALALHRIGSVQSLPALQRAIEKDPPCDTAFNAIASFGSDAQVPALLGLLNSGNSKKQALALRTLCSIKVNDARPVIAALLGVLQHSSTTDRLMVAAALARYKDQRALPFLRQFLNTGMGDFDSKRTCVRAVANLDGPESLALLHEMIQRRQFNRGDVEDVLVQRADPSSAAVVWEIYLKSPIRLVVSGWCATTGGYTDALRVLRVCADKEMLEKIRGRAAETTESREKRALGYVVAAIERRLSGIPAGAPF